jgi:hypothetical protein
MNDTVVYVVSSRIHTTEKKSTISNSMRMLYRIVYDLRVRTNNVQHKHVCWQLWYF